MVAKIANYIKKIYFWHNYKHCPNHYEKNPHTDDCCCADTAQRIDRDAKCSRLWSNIVDAHSILIFSVGGDSPAANLPRSYMLVLQNKQDA